MRAALAPHGLALVADGDAGTPADAVSRGSPCEPGFVYAVTMYRHHRQQGRSTGKKSPTISSACAAAAQCRCAPVRIRTRDQIQALRGMVDGVIVGSARSSVLERGESPSSGWRRCGPAPVSGLN